MNAKNKYMNAKNKYTTKQINTPPPAEKNAIWAYGKSLPPYGKSLNTPSEKNVK